MVIFLFLFIIEYKINDNYIFSIRMLILSHLKIYTLIKFRMMKLVQFFKNMIKIKMDPWTKRSLNQHLKS